MIISVTMINNIVTVHDINDMLYCGTLGAKKINVHLNTGCSLNIVFFSKNSRKFATCPSPALAHRSDCTLALKFSYSDVGEGGVSHIFRHWSEPHRPET